MVFSVLVIALLTGACADADGSGDAGAGSSGDLGSLTGMTFLSTAVTKNDQPYPLVGGTRISLQFTDTSISANAGCNHLGGDASYSDGVLVIAGAGMSMTEMGCDPPRMDQDSWLAGLLTSRPTVTLDGDRLTVTSGDTVIQLLDKETAEPDQPLAGTLWTLDSMGQAPEIGDDGIVSSIPAGVSSTLEIDDNGRLSLKPGCNTGGGDVTITDTTITFGPIALTRMACPGDPMDVENAVLKVLDGDVSYQIDGTMLSLTNGLKHSRTALSSADGG